ncbi:MAG TPA: hypothetical protein VKZ50_01420 [bacterium]|nr:hypothetical protein [bacterium]
MARRRRYGALTPRQQETSQRVARAVSRVRHGESSTSAIRAEHTSSTSFRKYAGATVYKTTGGRVRVRKVDTLVRELPWLNERGMIERVPVRGPEKSKVGRYWNAVKAFRDEGNARPLRDLKYKTFVDAKGVRRKFNRDVDMLRQRGGRGRLGFDDFYA